MEFEVTPETLAAFRSSLASVFDPGRVQTELKRLSALRGTTEYAFVRRPEVPLVLQGFRDCEAWIDALREQRPPPNLGALGPFVRLGLAVQLAAKAPSGPDRVRELRQHFAAGAYEKVANIAFELEAPLIFPDAPVEFGPLYSNPDFWLGSPPGRLLVEAKDVSGETGLSRQCEHAWKEFMVKAVKRMKAAGLCAGVAVRARQEFSLQDLPVLLGMLDETFASLAGVADGEWVVADGASGEDLMFVYRIGRWGERRPPLSVFFGLNGNVTLHTEYDTVHSVLINPFFLSLKFQAPLDTMSSVRNAFSKASKQLRKMRRPGPGLVMLKILPPRAGDLWRLDRDLRRQLREHHHHVSAVFLCWDATDWSDLAESGVRGLARFNFHLRNYGIINDAAVPRLPWPDSYSQYFPVEPKAVLATPDGDLVPFDYEAEQRAIEAGQLLTATGSETLLINHREGPLKFPHVIPEGSDCTEGEGRMTFYWKFREPLARSLLSKEFDQVLLEWFIVGRSQFRIYRDRHWNLRVNRRSSGFQDNVAIDLPPWRDAVELCLNLIWSAQEIEARLYLPDGSRAIGCKAVRIRES